MFTRSWMLTKLSFRVIKQDKEMLLFPLLAGIFSIAFAVALIYPTIVVELMRVSASADAEPVFTVLDYVLLFVAYFGLAFIATFFNVCVVFTTKTRFEGGDATFMDSLKFALSKIHLIFMWSFVSASVGILLRMLDNVAERFGAIGKLVIGIIVGLLGMVWSVITIFVVPAMVYHDLGPIQAVKQSVSTLKQTWGESLVRHYGLGFISFLFALLGVAITVGMAMTLGALGPVGIYITIGFAVVYFIMLTLIFNVANSVYNTALYAYANTGQAPGDFDEQTMVSAFRIKG